MMGTCFHMENTKSIHTYVLKISWNTAFFDLIKDGEINIVVILSFYHDVCMI